MKKPSLSLVLLFLTLAGFCLPFIFFRNTYPFVRFGMFAEPVKTEAQTEVFEVFFRKKPGSSLHRLQPDNDLLFFPESYRMQTRKHVYAGKAEAFLQKTARLYDIRHPGEQGAKSWFLVRKTISDSILIAGFEHEKP